MVKFVNDVLLHIILFLAHIIGMALVLVIFSSIFVRSKTKGYLVLIFIIFLAIQNLSMGFHTSVVMGAGMSIINLTLGILVYFNIKSKLEREKAF